MKVQLIRSNIIENLYSEEQLSDYGLMESIYAIRKLKALAESLATGSIEVQDSTNNSSQVFSVKYDIWFQAEEYKLKR